MNVSVEDFGTPARTPSTSGSDPRAGGRPGRAALPKPLRS